MSKLPVADGPSPALGPRPAARGHLFAAIYAPAADRPGGRGGESEAPARRTQLLALADAFSPRYEQPRDDLVVLDVRGLERLLGPARTIAEDIRRDAASRGVHVQVAVASTRVAALVLAQARPGLTIVPSGDEAAALATLPLTLFARVDAAALPVPGREAETVRQASADALTRLLIVLEQWGIRTWGAFAALPAASIAARFGASGPRWQTLARGVDLRPLVPLRPDEQFTASMPLEWPIEGLEPLSFVLTRLLEPLSTRLERADRGVATLHTTLRLITRDMHERQIALPAPLRDVRALRTLALLDLEAHPPAAAIDAVTIVVEPTPARVLQHTLFTRPQPAPEALSTLIARVTALMGQDRVGAPVAPDTHRPGAFAMQPFAIERPVTAPPRTAATVDAQGRPLVSALRRCRRPMPVRVTLDDAARPRRMMTDRRGHVTGAITSCLGPWSTSGDWWSLDSARDRTPGSVPLDSVRREPLEAASHKEGWEREEWDVVMADGTVYRLFRDCVRGGWFLDGTVD
jgi:protein ImuB